MWALVEVSGRGGTPDGGANLGKSLEDALVTAGLLVDDSPAWMESRGLNVQRSKVSQTTIWLEEVE